jgi:hypothetical protein
MAEFSPIINSFSRGQLTPWMKGRVDVEAYYKGAETMQNVFGRPFGGALRAPGTEYIADTKDSTKTSTLIPFVFSVSQSYAIEAGDLYFRFYVDGGQLTTASGAVEVVSPYSQTEVEAIQYAQSQDVLYMAHGSYRTRKLSRLSASTWSLDTETFYGGPYLDDNTTSTTITPSATTGSITITASTSIFTSDHVDSLWKIGGTTGSPAVQGYVRITGYTSGTQLSADVVETLDGTGATTTWAEGAWSDERGWPSTITFHEGRLFYGGTTYQPNKVWGSRPFLYDDFTPGADDDSAVSRELPTKQLNQIQWLSSERLLAVGTFGGEFTIGSGSSTEAITPSNITAINRTVEGSEAILPVRLRNRTYYVQREGRKLMEFFYIFDLDNYDSKNPTLFSENITGTGIKQLALQQNEDNIIWCVLNDGNIATMTREVDQEVSAWCVQTTDGSYESVTSIPRDGQFYDDVYVIVNRTINGATKRYVELFKSPRGFDDTNVIDNRSRLWYTHSSLTYDAYTNTSDSSIGLTLSAVSGTGVTATASGAWFTSADINGRIREIDSDGNTVGEATIVGFTSTTQVTVDVDAEQNFSSTSVAAGSWGRSTDDLSGLSHLEGESITVLGDGSELDAVTVSSGTASLSGDHFVIIAGLAYVSKVKTFPLEGGGAFGTSQGRYKKINKVGVRFYKTLGCVINNGEADKEIFNVEPDYVLGGPQELFTGDKVPFIRDHTRLDGQITIKQERPLPMNITAIMPFVETYDE